MCSKNPIYQEPVRVVIRNQATNNCVKAYPNQPLPSHAFLAHLQPILHPWYALLTRVALSFLLLHIGLFPCFSDV